MKIQKMLMPVLAGFLCLTFFEGCSSSENDKQQSQEISESTSGADMDSSIVPDTYKPSEFTILAQEKYENPDMGLDFTIPQKLQEQMDKQTIAMISFSELTEQENAISYLLFSWNAMTEEQKNAEVKSKGNGFYEWAEELGRIGTIGVYHSDQLDSLDQLTKCTEHREIGKSSDGNYSYYLSINQDADKDLTGLIKQIQTEVTEMVPLEELNENSENAGESLGQFAMKDIHDNSYTETMFQDYDLTMINVFTTWCTPCINEIPDLEKLYQDMKGKGVNVVGIVLDAIDDSGNLNSEALQKAELLAERTKVSYPFLIPDTGYLNGKLQGINSVPETFFVDKNGVIVGKTYSGSHNFEKWKLIVETELNSIKGEDQ